MGVYAASRALVPDADAVQIATQLASSVRERCGGTMLVLVRFWAVPGDHAAPAHHCAYSRCGGAGPVDARPTVPCHRWTMPTSLTKGSLLRAYVDVSHHACGRGCSCLTRDPWRA